MGSGTDVARERADVILIAISLSLLTRCGLRDVAVPSSMQNFMGALVVDGTGGGMAAFGLLNPLLAAFIHVVSELVFILNSTRLLPKSSKIGI